MPETRTTRGGTGRRRAPRPEPAPEPGHEDGSGGLVCNVAFCPICLAVTAAQGAAPEAVDHLLKAAREFFLAARAVIDTRADHLQGTEDDAAAKLERIDIA